MMIRPDQIDTTRDVIVDARLRPTEWRIPEARNCNALTCLSGAPPDLPAGRRIAVFSDSQQIAQAVVEHLHRCGYPGAAVLEGGFQGWWDLGMPLDSVVSFNEG